MNRINTAPYIFAATYLLAANIVFIFNEKLAIMMLIVFANLGTLVLGVIIYLFIRKNKAIKINKDLSIVFFPVKIEITPVDEPIVITIIKL